MRCIPSEALPSTSPTAVEPKLKQKGVAQESINVDSQRILPQTFMELSALERGGVLDEKLAG